MSGNKSSRDDNLDRKMSKEEKAKLKLMEDATKANREKISTNIQLFDPNNPGNDLFNTRINRRTCIQTGCNQLSNTSGFCWKHALSTENMNPEQLALYEKVSKALVESKRHDKMAASGNSKILSLHHFIKHPNLPFQFPAGGIDGFIVPGGRVIVDGKEVTLLTDLADLLDYGSAMDLYTVLVTRFAFYVPEELKQKYLRLQADGSIPRNHDFPDGIVMHRGSSFNEHEDPFLGLSTEYNQRRKNDRANRGAKQSGDEPVAKKSKPIKGGAKCENCGKGRSDGVIVTRGRCYEHRTEQSHPPCKHPGCTRGVTRKGFCSKHGEKCMIEGCTKQIIKASMCKRHYDEHHTE